MSLAAFFVILWARGTTEALSRRAPELFGLVLVTFFMHHVGLLITVAMLLWDRRHPEFPQQAHDDLAKSHPRLARVIYGRTPARVQESYEQRVDRAEKLRASGPKFFAKINDWNARGGFEAHQRSARASLNLILFMIGLAVSFHILGNAAVGYAALQHRASVQEVAQRSIERSVNDPDGFYQDLASRVVSRSDEEPRITWLESDQKIHRRILSIGGLGLGRLAHSLVKPDVDVMEPPAGTWNIALVEFDNDDVDYLSKIPKIACHYGNGQLDTRFTDVHAVGAMFVPQIEWAQPIHDLCPQTFNPAGETLASPVVIFPELPAAS